MSQPPLVSTYPYTSKLAAHSQHGYILPQHSKVNQQGTNTQNVHQSQFNPLTIIPSQNHTQPLPLSSSTPTTQPQNPLQIITPPTSSFTLTSVVYPFW